MQRCSHSFSTASALRSIFFPTTNQTYISTFLTPSYATDCPRAYSICTSQTRSYSSRHPFSQGDPSSRSVSGTRQPQAQHASRANAADLRKFGAQQDRRPKDEEIESDRILLVDQGAGAPRRVNLRDVLRRIDRSKHFVVQVGLEGEDPNAKRPAKSTDEDDMEEDGEYEQRAPVVDTRTPVCKIMGRKDYFTTEQSKGKKTSSGAKKPKELELSWSVDKNDLNHRLSKAEEFLTGGRKVDIFLAPKKRGKQLSLEEAHGVVKGVKDRLLTGTDFKEYKEMEGKVGETLTLYFEKKG